MFAANDLYRAANLLSKELSDLVCLKPIVLYEQGAHSGMIVLVAAAEEWVVRPE